jgi:sulfopyruvate decarboxylase TPP-binding subunit
MTFAQNSEMTGGRRQDIPVPMPSSSWQTQVYAALRAAHITQVGYVPDAGHAQLIEAAHADPDVHAVVLTTEEEGIALAAGAWR